MALLRGARMFNLPQFKWDVNPVFFQIPRPLVLVIAALIAGYSIYQDIRKNRSTAVWTVLLFAGLTGLAWKFTESKLGYAYFIGLAVAFIVEGARRKASDHYVTAALFASLGFLAWRFLPENLDLRYYSLLFVGVFLGGYAFLKWQIVRGGGPAEDAGDFIVYGVLGVLVGARLGHVLFYDLDKALADPAWVFQIWTGGLASHGAVLGLILAMYLFTKARGIPFLEGADRFAFSAALGATLVRVGNLMNSEIVGRRVPGQTWGFYFPRFDHTDHPVYRYPTQLGEIFLGLLVLGALFLVDKKLGKERRPRGVLISTFFAVYFVGRFIIEFWKEYEPPLPEGTPYPSSLTTGQLLSIPGVLLGFYGIYWALKRRIPVGWPSARLAEDESEQHQRGRAAERDDEDDELDEDDEDDEDDDEERDSKTKGSSTKKSAKPARDAASDDRDDDSDDDDSDDDDSDDDDSDDGDDKATPRERDADIDDEFDEKGALKRRRGPPDT
jgi:phosphatidylglycerol:prolipoprotein diacylglycerol transferase